jgi:hypothetical protein
MNTISDFKKRVEKYDVNELYKTIKLSKPDDRTIDQNVHKIM